jgi:CxxC motif-containing protein (DUF1111 family)
VLVRYEARTVSMNGGESAVLMKPSYSLEKLGYGPLAAGLLMSPRVAPAMPGLGLLESVPEATLRSHADPEDRDRDGISGRVNLVWDGRTTAVGRFGWKAEQPSVINQCAGALAGDMGITSGLVLSDACSPAQDACRRAQNGGVPEASDDILAAIATYSRALAVPERRGANDPSVERGEALFESAGCARCHLPVLKTGPDAVLAELADQTIHPYSDLLLHDLGPRLSDERPVYEAAGSEWRTPPLWGVGLIEKVNGHTLLLHDGRARNFTEAILWHGGEAGAARANFAGMTRAERVDLLAFLSSL